MTHHSDVNVTGDWTVEVWFKDETPGGYNHAAKYILSKGTAPNSADMPYFIGINNNELIVGERVGSANRTLRYNLAANGVSANAWHHLAATMQASNRQLTLYVDGVQVLQGTLTSHSTAGNTLSLFIGRNGTAGQGWQGKLDDMRLWNRVRTKDEIAANYRNELTSAPPGLVGNWKFNEVSGTTAADSASPAQNATLKGGAVWSTDQHP